MDNIRHESDEPNELDDVLDHSYFAVDSEEGSEDKTSTPIEDGYFRRISDL